MMQIQEVNFLAASNPSLEQSQNTNQSLKRNSVHWVPHQNPGNKNAPPRLEVDKKLYEARQEGCSWVKEAVGRGKYKKNCCRHLQELAFQNYGQTPNHTYTLKQS